MRFARLSAVLLLLIVSTTALAWQGGKDGPVTAPVADPENSSASEECKIRSLWATNSGVILILDEMPDGVDYFRIDLNTDQKLALLLAAADEGKAVLVIYDAESSSQTREVYEVRLNLDRDGADQDDDR